MAAMALILMGNGTPVWMQMGMVGTRRMGEGSASTGKWKIIHVINVGIK